MKKFIERTLSAEILAMSQQYPVVTIMGPRQSGKTALVKHLFRNKPYINLEDPDEREKWKLDPRKKLSQYPDGAIFDEVQRAPELLSYVQTHVDHIQKNGLFVLTGSHQPMLHQTITQSLAGRTALLQLFPFSFEELVDQPRLSLEEQLLKGFYPRLYTQNLVPHKFYRNYLQTYVERDVRMLINVKDVHLFQSFLRLCAGRVGQLINYDGICNELGVSSHTVKHWLSILEASFILLPLQPYHENIGKRLTKSAKLFFVDVGLAAYLLGIETPEQLSRDPARGHLFENMVVLDLIKARINAGEDPQLYFFRDQQQHEVDVLFKQGHEFIPIEIKASQTFHPHFLKGIHYFEALMGSSRILDSKLIYAGQSETLGKTTLLNYQESAKALVPMIRENLLVDPIA